jgi:hypothetical protein
MHHYDAAIMAIKPFVVSVAIGSISMMAVVAESIFAQTDVAKTFEAIGVYGLPTVLVVYFIARDWYREAVADKRKETQEQQAVKDREDMVKVTEARDQRSHEARQNRERELVQAIAAERQRNHELVVMRHQDHVSLLELIRTGKIQVDNVQQITDSTTGKFLPRQ